MLEERQKLEDEQRKKKQRDQEVILNKKNARGKISFSLGGKV
jgi:arginine/glutamate-rich protein 1